jgi:ATP-binding cassette subfamily C protein LapB
VIGAAIRQAAEQLGLRLDRRARARLSAVDAMPDMSVLELAQRGWEAAGLPGSPALVSRVTQEDCPFLLKHRTRGMLVVRRATAPGEWEAQDASGAVQTLRFGNEVQAIRFPKTATATPRFISTASLVFAEVRKHKSIFFESLLATFLVDIIGLATSLFSMQVYDRVIPGKGYDTLAVLGVGVAVAIGMGFVLNAARSYVLDRTSSRIDGALSNWFFLRALGIRMESRPASVGAFAAQVKGLEMLRGILCSTSLFVIADLPFALFFIAVIFCLGGPLALVPVVLFPVSLGIGLCFQHRLNRLSAENERENTSKTGLLVESIDGIECIKANGSAPLLASRWRRLTDSIAERDCRIKFATALSSYVTTFLQQLGYVSIVGYGAYLVTENQLTTGALLACSIICSRALSPVGKLPGVMLQWANLRAVTDGLNKLVSRPNEMDEQDAALSPERLEPSLRLEQVQFCYPDNDRKALNVPKLEVRPGERVGILGAIGSGKSTLLKVASGLYRPNEGKVFIGGVDAAVLAPQRLQRAVAYVPQDVRLLSGTLRDNLLQGLADPGDDAVLDAVRQTGLMPLVALHPKGLALPIHEGGHGLSGGQRQLVALTRMLLARPDIILLDEPTASMDAATEANVVRLLDRLASEGATLIVATHRTALLPILPRLLVFEQGMFAVDGPRQLVLEHLAAKGVPSGAAQPARKVVPLNARAQSVRGAQAG